MLARDMMALRWLRADSDADALDVLITHTAAGALDAGPDTDGHDYNPSGEYETGRRELGGSPAADGSGDSPRERA